MVLYCVEDFRVHKERQNIYGAIQTNMWGEMHEIRITDSDLGNFWYCR